MLSFIGGEGPCVQEPIIGIDGNMLPTSLCRR